MNLETTAAKVRTVGLGALGFMVIQAISSLLFRRVLLGELYANSSFYEVTEPTLGLFIQSLSFYFLTGAILTVLFMHMYLSGGGKANATRYAILTGIMYWLIHDYSYIGRKMIGNELQYLGLEAILVVIIFALFSLVLGRLFRSKA